MAKEVVFSESARVNLVRCEHTRRCRMVTMGPKGRNVVIEKSRFSYGHQRRRHGRERNRARAEVREHGRPDGEGGRFKDLRRRW